PASAPLTERAPSEPELPRRPAGEGLRERDNAPMIGFLDQRLMDRIWIIGRDRAQRDLRLDPAPRSPSNEASYDCVLRRAPRPRAAGARGEIDPVDPGFEDRGVPVARRKIRAQGPRQSLRGRLLNPARGRYAGERAQRPDFNHDAAKPQAVLRSRGGRCARQGKPECAKEGERTPTSHGADDHSLLLLRRRLARPKTTRKKGRPSRNHGLPGA